jgi:hypothetical protein
MNADFPLHTQLKRFSTLGHALYEAGSEIYLGGAAQVLKFNKNKSCLGVEAPG